MRCCRGGWIKVYYLCTLTSSTHFNPFLNHICTLVRALSESVGLAIKDPILEELIRERWRKCKSSAGAGAQRGAVEKVQT